MQRYPRRARIIGTCVGGIVGVVTGMATFLFWLLSQSIAVAGMEESQYATIRDPLTGLSGCWAIVTHPLLGAVIGYLIGWVAIRFLHALRSKPDHQGTAE